MCIYRVLSISRGTSSCLRYFTKKSKSLCNFLNLELNECHPEDRGHYELQRKFSFMHTNDTLCKGKTSRDLFPGYGTLCKAGHMSCIQAWNCVSPHMHKILHTQDTSSLPHQLIYICVCKICRNFCGSNERAACFAPISLSVLSLLRTYPFTTTLLNL